jgi:hypothetical protein
MGGRSRNLHVSVNLRIRHWFHVGRIVSPLKLESFNSYLDGMCKISNIIMLVALL